MRPQPGVAALAVRTGLRHWRSTPGQMLLLVALLSLGVAAYLSIRLANRAALSSFARFADTLTGESDWIVRAPVGDLSIGTLAELRDALGTEPVHVIPLIETPVAVTARTGSTDTTPFARASFTLLGADLVSLANLLPQGRGAGAFIAESTSARGEASPRFWEVLGVTPHVWVSPQSPLQGARSVSLIVNDRLVEVPVAGLIPMSPEAPAPPRDLLIMDLPQAQRLLQREGRLDRIEVIVEPGPHVDARRAKVGEHLRAWAGDRLLVTRTADRAASAAVMTQAFRLNLTVLSLIALIVGLYLVFQALDGAVVRRRVEIGILRSLGVEERTIRLLWLAESAVLGVLGSVVGIALGWLGAQVAVRSVGATVNALYFSTTVQAAQPYTEELLGALVLGVAASVVAGWWPARAAARVPPAQVLQRTSTAPGWQHPVRDGGLALVLIAIGAWAAQLPPWPLAGGGRFPVAGYLAAFCWIGGGGVLSGALLPLAGRGLRCLGRGSAVISLATSHVRSPTGRHRLAVAALHCAVGMTAGMIVLVASFESTIRGWIQRSLQADLYVASAAAAGSSAGARVTPDAVKAIATHPAVETVAELGAYPLTLESKEVNLHVLDLALTGTRVPMSWIRGPADERVFDPNRNGDLAVVSEAFSDRFRRRVGDHLVLPMPDGPWRVQVAGVFADYGDDGGTVLVDRRHFLARGGEDKVTNLSVWLSAGTQAETVRAELLPDFPGLSIYTNARLREEILRIFRQTFSITYALEVIGVVVAMIGLGTSLASVLMDRRDELTTLRALGLTRGEIATAAAMEGLFVATGAVAGGLVLSFGLGWLLIAVINKQSFGWTLGFVWPWRSLLALGTAVIASGVGVSYLVGRWGAQLPADQEE